MSARNLWRAGKVAAAYLIIGVITHLLFYGAPDFNAAWTYCVVAFWPVLLIGKFLFVVVVGGLLSIALFYLWGLSVK